MAQADECGYMVIIATLSKVDTKTESSVGRSLSRVTNRTSDTSSSFAASLGQG